MVGLRRDYMALLVGMGVIPTEAIVPVPHSGHKLRGARVSELGHCRLAGVEPGPYGDSGSDGKCLLYADTIMNG